MKTPRPTLRVLIVEDHDDSREMLEHLLDRQGYAVSAAGSCGRARELAASAPYDMVICDIDLPDGDGVELMRELRRQYLMITIALTGLTRPSDIERCTKAGVHAFLAKPIAIEGLVNAIKQLMILPDAIRRQGPLIVSHGVGDALAGRPPFLET
jgi:two-component system CheB/CheR fusion protein